MRAAWLLAGLLAASAPAAADGPASDTLRGVAEVGVGMNYSCARTEAGRVYCWGRGDQGHLVQMQSSSRPIEIALPAPARRLWVRGDMPACVELARDGSLWCWGDHDRPHVVSGLEHSDGVLDLRQSPLMRCALLADGTVRCGRGAMRPVEGLAEVEQLRLRAEFACARTRGGAVRCWGSNDLGQLGAGVTARASDRPLTPKGLDRGVVDLAVMGDGACVVLSGGAVRCWGEAGMEKPVRFGRTPAAIALPSPARSLHGWINGLVALLSDGTLMTWGYSSVGSGKWGRVATPARVASGVVAVSEAAPMFVSTAVGWQCFGACLGLFSSSPFGPSGLPPSASAPVHDVASTVTCAVSGGEVLCRGSNDFGQLGDGTNIERRLEWRSVVAPARAP